MNTFYKVLANVVASSITNMTVWFALIFYTYIETQSVFATSMLSGIYLVVTTVTGIWFGSIVDHNKKKTVMMLSSIVSLAIYIIGFLIYIFAPAGTFQDVSSWILWLFITLLLLGVMAGNLRGIALPTTVTLLVPADNRDKANGLVGTTTGIAFLIVSVISGFLVAWSGMYLVLILAIVFTLITMVHLATLSIPEKEIVHLHPESESQTGENGEIMGSENPVTMGKGIDLAGTIKVISLVPGLFPLIFFATFNNFLGGVFMSLMDAYGLSMVSVEIWGLLWGFLSTAFIVGGIIIAKFGLGKSPLRSLFLANIVIWAVSMVFTVQPSIILLTVGCFIYLMVVPFIEAAEHTIMQKVVPYERQGRVFGFAQSVEQSASPLTAFMIGPIAQFATIPFMTTGWGSQNLATWLGGTGTDRGIALIFIAAGIIGLAFTILAMNSKYYRRLSEAYAKVGDKQETAPEAA